MRKDEKLSLILEHRFSSFDLYSNTLLDTDINYIVDE